MRNLYLCFMAGPNSLEDLRELTEPLVAHIDGVVAVLHDARDSEEATYLESIKSEGAIIHIPFSRRHSFSRNHYLWCGPIEEGDWILQCDVLERINPLFAARIPDLIAELETHGINAAFYYNKAFLYRWHESLEFAGSPHEGLRRNDGQLRAVELSTVYPIESDVRYSVRAAKRTDLYGWVGHYLKYYLYPYGSNHCLLGNCDRGDEMTIFRQREAIRNAFRDEMIKRGIKMTNEALIQYWRETPLDDKMINWINQEKILNDAYRYYIRGDLTVIDEHRWVSLKPI